MIQAHFHRSEDAGIYSVTITGHAGSGPYGYDLVCAAVSALSIGAVNSLAQLGGFTPDVDMDEIEGGYLDVSLPGQLSDSQQKTSQILMESLLLSLRSVSDEYPDYLSIVEHLK